MHDDISLHVFRSCYYLLLASIAWSLILAFASFLGYDITQGLHPNMSYASKDSLGAVDFTSNINTALSLVRDALKSLQITPEL